MKVLTIHAESKISKILIGERLSNVMQYIKGRKIIILTDSNLLKYYGRQFPENVPVIVMGLGEKNKTLSSIEYIIGKLVEHETDRSTFLLAIGGGIVCDVGGFVASIYMRGIPFGFVSTTLLAQVDASVGGKNGVNYKGFKNMAGVFNQPEFVICDNEMLGTLDKEEFRSGFAEIIKAGAIKDISLFNYCRDHARQSLKNDEEVIHHLVYESVRIKADVVAADEREKDERRLLNFGHSFAHSIEKMSTTLHGRAVSIGMVLAARVSQHLGMISDNDTKMITDVIKSYGLPVHSEIPVEKLFDAMKQDKKREGDSIHLVLLEKLGKAVTRKISFNELQKITHDLRSNI